MAKEPKDIAKTENGGVRSEEKPKPKRARVSPRKELAVVTVGMVAAIASFGGLLTGNQSQADQPIDAAPTAEVASVTPGSSNAPDAQSQGS